jgi:MFS family permease
MVAGTINGYYSPARDTIEPGLGFDELESTLFNTCGIVFAMFGGLISKPFVHCLGRRKSVFGASFLTLLGFIMLALSKAKWVAFVPRIVSGLSMGILNSVCAMYLIEIAPEKYRGTFGVFYQILNNCGVLYDYILGVFFSWRNVTWMSLIIPGAYCLLIFTVPDSPVSETKPGSLFQKLNMKPFFHMIGLIFLQQFSGINAVLSNMDSIFQMAGSVLNSGISSVIVGLGFVASPICCSLSMNMLGRRIPLLISFVCETISLAFLWINDVWGLSDTFPFVSMLLYMIGFGFGLGPVVWLVVPELFDQTVRSNFMAIGIGWNWFLGGVIAFVWPIMIETIHFGWSCFFFGVFQFFGIFYSIFLMPDTSGKINAAESEGYADIPEKEIP